MSAPVAPAAPAGATRHAVRLGLRRGWTEFLLSVRSPQDQGFYLFTAVVSVGYLWLNRDGEVEGTTLSFPTVALPSVLAALAAFGVFMGPVFALAMEREDGTLLRHKAVPHGMQGCVTGQLVLHALSAVPQLLVVLVPSWLLFDGLVRTGAGGWLVLAGVVVLGMAALLPWGMVVGALVPSTQKAGTWGMLPVLVVVGISGVFVPLQQMWGWLQAVAQVFPVYWLGLGLRSAVLPDAAAALEVGGSWRTGTTVAVLGAWCVVGLLVAPPVLRRMARRQSGSQVQAARDAALQWVR
ncbi:ABC transporter permease [Vallicoccus soli]|uniref:ABC transporter permease n=1 Tax=Vallicoccus soli TaxID=2339232 RepID=A0A3A3Z2Q1_9ACTN|nr:ABC transporter permease [Vallicoccus soli]RJK97004.1 ABC transporter permease [Vallicoccus soli]